MPSRGRRQLPGETSIACASGASQPDPDAALQQMVAGKWAAYSASSTKTSTAAAIMLLHQRGRLDGLPLLAPGN